MKKYVHIALIFICILLISSVNAQVNRPLSDADKAALEGIIVEKYYTYDPSETLDTAGGALPKGAVTYRIYVDMKPGYTLQAVYGVNEHPLTIKTTTFFYNNVKSGQGTADYVNSKDVINSTAAFDSWVTMGAANTSYMGVPKADDTDGSVLKIASLAKADGLMAAKIKPATYFGIIPRFFNTYNTATTFTTNNGSWAIFGGIQGATPENKVLIAQLTTDGTLSFELNVQIGTPTGGNVNYVARNAQNAEIVAASLTK